MAQPYRYGSRRQNFISLILGLAFVLIGLYGYILGVADSTIALLTIVIGLFSIGTAAYRLLRLRRASLQSAY